MDKPVLAVVKLDLPADDPAPERCWALTVDGATSGRYASKSAASRSRNRAEREGWFDDPNKRPQP